MSFFSRLFTSSKPEYLFDTLESLKDADPGQIVLYFEKINPNIWENTSYEDSHALDVLGKDRVRALMFGIRHSNKPPEKRIEMWQRQEEEKSMKRSLNFAPSTRNLPTPGWRNEEQVLMDRLARLKQGGRRKSKKTKGHNSMKSKSKRRKSIRRKRKSMKMH